MIQDPGFRNPTPEISLMWPADDYAFLGAPPPGFTPWTYATGASGGVVPPFPVPPGFPTATYAPADF